jgi:hypothetical protein
LKGPAHHRHPLHGCTKHGTVPRGLVDKQQSLDSPERLARIACEVFSARPVAHEPVDLLDVGAAGVPVADAGKLSEEGAIGDAQVRHEAESALITGAGRAVSFKWAAGAEWIEMPVDVALRSR